MFHQRSSDEGIRFNMNFILLYGHKLGKDIFISNDIEEIVAFVDEQTQGFVVQKYIENPLLLDKNRKFDIRSVLKHCFIPSFT